MEQVIQLLIIDNREKTGKILEEVFKVHGGYHVTRIKENDIYDQKPYDIVITEIKRNITVIDAVKKVNPGVRIIFFYNVSRDKFIEEMYAESIETLLDRSFKVKDLLNVTRQVSATRVALNSMGLELYLDPEHRLIETKEFTSASRQVGDDIILAVNLFLRENDIHLKIHDLEIFDIAVMEILDNVFQAQDKSNIKPYHLQLNCGFDREKFVLSVGANTGNVNKDAVLSSIQRKMQHSADDEQDINPDDEYIDGKYFGSQGRGFYIIQKGVHRLSVVILDKEAAQKFNRSQPWFETSIVLYFEKNSSEVKDFQSGVGLACMLDL